MKLSCVPFPKPSLNPVLLCWIAVALASLACNPAAILGPTPTPTASSTPTPTSTPTSTPSPLPSSTPLPTETAEPLALLGVEDLPPGFESVPPEDFGLEEGQEFAEGFTIGNAFAFVEPTSFEVIFGFTMPLERRLDQVGFDVALERPEVLIEAFVAGLGETGYEEVAVLEGMDQIGDKSNGIGLVMFIDPLAFQVEMVIFRKGELGAFLMLMYFQGEQPSTVARELAETMAARAPGLSP